MSFKEIESQPRVVSILKAALEKEQLPHAFLFLGPAGSDKQKTARALGKCLLCENRRGAEACGMCIHCRQVDRNAHPDFMVFEPAEDSSFIKIEQIRELIAKANLKPFSARAKLFVINQADRMNDAAQNALLKTLEEPEGRTYFVLISSASEGLLATIRSRTQTLHFLPLKAQAAEEPKIEKTKGEILRWAASGFDEGVMPPDLAGLDRAAVGRIFEGVIVFLRDALLLRVGVETLAGLSGEERHAGALGREFDEDEIAEMIGLFAEFKERITVENANLKISQSVLWDALKALSRSVQP